MDLKLRVFSIIKVNPTYKRALNLFSAVLPKFSTQLRVSQSTIKTDRQTYKKLFKLIFAVSLHDVFESTTFIFLVFELCRNGELFDYLTNVVTLSEKKTR